MKGLIIALGFAILPVVAADYATLPAQASSPTASTGTQALDTHEQWLLKRLDEARGIKVGSTSSELGKYFTFDGGPNGSKDGHFRCDLISCPLIKIDVVLVDRNGEKLNLTIFDQIPKDARVSSVSKPYLETPLSD